MVGQQKIDLVVLYVDSSDKNWQELFNQYNPSEKISEEVNAVNRFRGQGDFFKYWFRCVARNLWWINKVHLVVQSESQVPKWINRNVVHVVTHNQIIPEEFLPTFNSTAIEMFIHRIPGLAERFLYANDDIYPMREMKLDNFFDGFKVKDSTRPIVCNHEMYIQHCLNGYCLVNNIDKEDYMRLNTKLPSFRHTIRPYLKSEMESCYNKFKDMILKSITRFREPINYNIYLFDYYNIYRGIQLPSFLSAKCISTKSSGETIRDSLRRINYDILAIQDNEVTEKDIYKNLDINYYFMNVYRGKSKYEN